MTCDSCGHTVCNYLPSCPHCEDGKFRIDFPDFMVFMGVVYLFAAAFEPFSAIVLVGYAQMLTPTVLTALSCLLLVLGFILHLIMKRHNDHPDLSYIRRWKYLSD